MSILQRDLYEKFIVKALKKKYFVVKALTEQDKGEKKIVQYFLNRNFFQTNTTSIFTCFFEMSMLPKRVLGCYAFKCAYWFYGKHPLHTLWILRILGKIWCCFKLVKRNSGIFENIYKNIYKRKFLFFLNKIWTLYHTNITFRINFIFRVTVH